MTAARPIVQVAVPSPLARHFDYLLPAGIAMPSAGSRVRVPFGRREVIGVVVGQADHSDLPGEKLKPLCAVLDDAPLLSSTVMELLEWAAAYYHHPVGDVLHTAMPVLLRRGAAPTRAGETLYSLTAAGQQLPAETFRRSPVQQRLAEHLARHPQGVAAGSLRPVVKNWQPPLQKMISRGWVETREGSCLPPCSRAPQAAPILTPDQATAITTIRETMGRFKCLLLHGVTGSGKTEIYLKAIEDAVASGRQVLVLVPEIGLTPQLISRFEARFQVPIAVMHSGLNEGERLCAWEAARRGEATIILGTRSAVFTPLPRLALILIDEEHDASFKQQDGFRYHARDVAIKRARLENVPVVLGSATPALESMHNVEQGRYQLLTLASRAGNAQPPHVRMLDLRRLAVQDGLSAPLVEALQERLARREQSLLFLNRRGFAPVLMCHDCGWLAPCKRCDARLTIHQRSHLLRCHHCGAEAPIPSACPNCQGSRLHGIGEGTERIETTLARLLPHARIERVDRDSTRRKGSLEGIFRRVHDGEVDILVGTQMLTKGHDFPNLTLVGVLNADQGLYSADFRSEERLVQQLVQVTGRAGRADKPGLVLVQTFHPEHPVFAALAHHDYTEFSRFALAERQGAGYPPFSHLALLRAESPKPDAALGFLHAAHVLAGRPEGVQVMDPVPSPMERRAGRYRAQLLVQADERRALHAFLGSWYEALEHDKHARQVRWSLDVDPVDLY